MRLITCSNSAPRLTEKSGATAAPGGLVPILSSLVEEVGGHWAFAVPAASGDAEAGRESPDPAWSAAHLPKGLHPVHFPARQHHEQREVICIRTLLWLFHYLHDTATEPAFDHSINSAWQAYKEVNEQFAGVLTEVCDNSADEVVLVNDFHLMLVPSAFAAGNPGRRGRLVYFHHVPWCEPTYFTILPAPMRTAILESLLACDFAGFHCDRWGEAFLSCCAAFLPGAHVAGRTVTYRGHDTVVTTAPGPIDAGVLDELGGQAATEQWRELLRKHAGGRRIIARVDRLDLWKNVVRGFAAYETVLRARPRLARDFWFCAIATPPRLRTERHKRYQLMCENAVARLNDRYGGDRDAAGLIYPDNALNQRNRAVAALDLSSVTLVNPTFDGLNMVAKESLVVNPAARLLLSPNAGAYDQLAGLSTPVQPFDVEHTADVLRAAMTGDAHERPPAGRLAALRGERATAWLRAVLAESHP